MISPVLSRSPTPSSSLETLVFHEENRFRKRVRLAQSEAASARGRHINVRINKKNSREDVLSLPPPYSALVHSTAFERRLATAEWASRSALRPHISSSYRAVTLALPDGVLAHQLARSHVEPLRAASAPMSITPSPVDSTIGRTGLVGTRGFGQKAHWAHLLF